MTDLERLAAAILTQWRADGGAEDGLIAVSALLDRVLPYRVARRILRIDVSEDYEALVLRLLAEDEDLVRVDPVEAADMAKATITSRLPDLDVLQLLRSATMRFTERTITRLSDVLPMPSSKEDAKWAAAPVAKPEAPPPPPAAATASDGRKPSSRRKAAPIVNDDVSSGAKTIAPDVTADVSSQARAASEGAATPIVTPEPHRDTDIIPLHPTHPPVVSSTPTDPPAEFLTTVVFTPPSPAHCWSCAEALPVDRVAKFCPFCGADQRQPTCAECGAVAERAWKHCPDCGVKL